MQRRVNSCLAHGHGHGHGPRPVRVRRLWQRLCSSERFFSGVQTCSKVIGRPTFLLFSEHNGTSRLGAALGPWTLGGEGQHAKLSLPSWSWGMCEGREENSFAHSIPKNNTLAQADNDDDWGDDAQAQAPKYVMIGRVVKDYIPEKTGSILTLIVGTLRRSFFGALNCLRCTRRACVRVQENVQRGCWLVGGMLTLSASRAVFTNCFSPRARHAASTARSHRTTLSRSSPNLMLPPSQNPKCIRVQVGLCCSPPPPQCYVSWLCFFSWNIFDGSGCSS